MCGFVAVGEPAILTATMLYYLYNKFTIKVTCSYLILWHRSLNIRCLNKRIFKENVSAKFLEELGRNFKFNVPDCLITLLIRAKGMSNWFYVALVTLVGIITEL